MEKKKKLVEEEIEPNKSLEAEETVEEHRNAEVVDKNSAFKLTGEDEEGSAETELPEDIEDIDENLFPSAE